MKSFVVGRRFFPVVLVLIVSVLGGASAALLGICGPFTDVTDATFCPFVLEIFTLGITTGTTPTTYAPTDPVSRLQMAAFLSRTVDGVLKRGSRRAALDQFWTTQNERALGLTTIGIFGPSQARSDGADVWVAVSNGIVVRVRASDGKPLETWTGASGATGVTLALGRVLVCGSSAAGNLYQIDPGQPAGAVTTVATNLTGNPTGIAFDGSHVWVANGSSGFVSIVTPGATIPWTVTNVGGFSNPSDAIFDGSNIWITQATGGTIRKVDSNGATLLTVTVGNNAEHAAFDGANLWVPNFNSNSVSVVRASNGAVLATLTGNGLSTPVGAAFDGQRVLVTNQNADSVSLFKAADLTPIGTFETGTGSMPFGACSDGVNFWITLQGAPYFLARF